MGALAIIKLVCIVVGIFSAGGGILYLKHRLKKGDQAIVNEKVLRKQKTKATKVEKKKNKIREEHDEKANNIINNPNGDNDVLPDGESREHNHSFRDTCTSDCPAYIE